MTLGWRHGSSARKHILKLRGAILSDAQRKPGTALSPIARSEVGNLLARLAERDARAKGLG
jgi:4-hydroxy-tetrahydrodipicolinate synthase